MSQSNCVEIASKTKYCNFYYVSLVFYFFLLESTKNKNASNGPILQIFSQYFTILLGLQLATKHFFF